MLYAIYCVDKPGSGELRQRTRPEHLAYLNGFKDMMLVVGPLLADDGATPCGSLFIMEFPDGVAAEAFATGDPYARAGVFGEVSIRPFRKAFP
jgi:uncharacterized protein